MYFYLYLTIFVPNNIYYTSAHKHKNVLNALIRFRIMKAWRIKKKTHLLW